MFRSLKTIIRELYLYLTKVTKTINGPLWSFFILLSHSLSSYQVYSSAPFHRIHPPVWCSSYTILRHHVSHPCETAGQITQTFAYLNPLLFWKHTAYTSFGSHSVLGRYKKKKLSSYMTQQQWRLD